MAVAITARFAFRDKLPGLGGRFAPIANRRNVLCTLLRRTRLLGSLAVERQAAAAITAAIRSCLDDCQETEAPLLAIAQTVERLRAADWNEADVRRVEAVVRKVLVSAIVEEESPQLDNG